MHGQSPTSTKPAGATGNPAKSLSGKEKVTLRMGLKRTPMDPSALAFAAGREALVGGKDYGSGDVRVLDFEERRSHEPFEKRAAGRVEGAEVSFPSSVKGVGAIGNRGFRPGVGKRLRAVGVSPQSRQTITENR